MWLCADQRKNTFKFRNSGILRLYSHDAMTILRLRVVVFYDLLSNRKFSPEEMVVGKQIMS